MKLANRFKDVDKMRVWMDHPYCALCKSNQGCALHHIDGTVSGSIYNAIMLCNSCHKKADGHNTHSSLSEEYRKGLRAIAFAMVIKSNHQDTQYDKDYLAHYSHDFRE